MSGGTKAIYVDEKIKEYLEKILQATREPRGQHLSRLAGMIEAGAPPEDFERILQLAKDRAIREERMYLVPKDIRDAAKDTLGLTLILSRQAEAAGLNVEEVIQSILDCVEAP